MFHVEVSVQAGRLTEKEKYKAVGHKHKQDSHLHIT